MQTLLLFFLIVLLSGCTPDSKSGGNNAADFGQPIRVEVSGYSGNIMEPFLSRSGDTLLFNNLNASPENTNLHWATKINDSNFAYQGEIAGLNTAYLEGVPSLDESGNLFFVSNRSYATTLSTLYQCNFSNGVASNVQLVDGLSKLQMGWVNFDLEVSSDGQSLYFVDGQIDQSGIPTTADLILARKNGSGFQRSPNTNTILKNINTNSLEYAACISSDNLELYFTQLALPVTAASLPEILVSTRKTISDPFGLPSKIQSITGFVEGPTISPDQKTLYYHKKENNKFVLYMVRKK